MRVEQHEGAAASREEIEHAIDSVKRSRLDRWMRTEWHKAGARNRWSRGRKVRWMKWKRQGLRGGVSGGSHRPDRPHVRQSMVWVKGHVPREFMDWVERRWSHDDEARAMLSGWGAKAAGSEGALHGRRGIAPLADLQDEAPGA